MSGDTSIPKDAKIYLNKPYVQLFWDPAGRILTSRWLGFCTNEEINAVGKRILDAVTFEKAEKVLYDARGIELLDEESQNYISGVFVQEMVGSGVKYAATVFPQDLLAKFSIDDIQRKLTRYNASSISFFDSIKSACDWLNSK